jgi:hypothetical protein
MTTTEAFEAPEERDLDDGSELLGDPDEHDHDVCDRCGGDGMDPWNDYLFECPECNGRSPL